MVIDTRVFFFYSYLISKVFATSSALFSSLYFPSFGRYSQSIATIAEDQYFFFRFLSRGGFLWVIYWLVFSFVVQLELLGDCIPGRGVWFIKFFFLMCQ